MPLRVDTFFSPPGHPEKAYRPASHLCIDERYNQNFIFVRRYQEAGNIPVKALG